MLSGKVTIQRLKAARMAAGIDQAEMGRLLKKDGLKARHASDIERGAMRAQSGHLESYARHTGFPLAWFMEPNLRLVFAQQASSPTQTEIVELWRAVERLAENRERSAVAETARKHASEQRG